MRRSLFGCSSNRDGMATLWEDPECETEVTFNLKLRPPLQNVVLERLWERRAPALRRPVRLV